MGHVATKLLSLIMLLQSRKSWKVAELAVELGVSGRTVHRYFGMLEDMGIPICSERGRHGGFSLMRGYRLPPLIFSAEEATVLYMGAHLVRKLMGQTYHDAVTGATAKLDNVLPDMLRDQVRRAQEGLLISGLTALDYSPWDQTIHVLRQCIEEHRRVFLRYRGFQHQETERRVDPYALVLRWGLWYLVGFCHLRQDMRIFRVDRVQGVRALDDTFDLIEGFSVAEYMELAMRFEPQFEVKVHLQADAVLPARERYGHWMRITDLDDGTAMASFGAADLSWATGWVLSLGSAARVAEPEELETRVVAAAHAILQVYAE